MARAPTDVIDERWRELYTETTEPADITYADQITHWRDRTPAGYVDQYNRLLQRNCAPRIAAAVCWYVAGLQADREARSQAEIAAEFDISEPTIRRWYRQILPEER